MFINIRIPFGGVSLTAYLRLQTHKLHENPFEKESVPMVLLVLKAFLRSLSQPFTHSLIRDLSSQRIPNIYG